MLAAWLLVLAAACRPTPVPVFQAEQVWFDDLAQPLRLDQDEARALARRAMQGLRGAALSPVHERLMADRAPRVVFLSVSDTRHAARVAVGAEQGVIAAVDGAAERLRGQAAPTGQGPMWLKLDIVAEVGPILSVRWDEPLSDDSSLHGLAFGRSTRLAFLAEELWAHRLVDSRMRMRRERMTRAAEARDLTPMSLSLLGSDETLAIRRFSTESFFFDGHEAHRLYRGHVWNQTLDQERLRKAVQAGAEYLTRVVDEQGRFVYAYLAKQDRAKDDYNLVRHAGTVFAMLEAWELLGDPALLAAAERAIGYMIRFIEPFGGPDAGMSVLVEGDKIKLGGVALAALALVTHARVTGQSTHIELARRLCRYIRASQAPDGSFVHQRHHPGGQPLGFVSQYYPGEALLALTALYELDRDPSWLDTAEAGARYLIEVRDRGLATRDLIHDHWLLYALERLHSERPRPLYLDHAVRIVQAILDAQIRSSPFPDHVGGYESSPRSTPVATRNEGLLAAYRLARNTGRVDLARAILEAVELGAKIQLAMQIDPARAMYLPNPQAALGGFTRGYIHFEVRIDYVQHSLSAFLALMSARRIAVKE